MARCKPTSTWRTDLILCLAVGALGLAPHLYFSWATGALTYFKGAYDEDTYFILRNEIGFYRYLSTRLTDFLYRLAGVDAAMILMDFLLPVFAAAGALFFARRVARAAGSRALIALLLLFSPDLFSLANFTLWRTDYLGIARGMLGPIGSQLIPDATSTFLNLYRSPEPQLSLGILFFLWGILVDIVRRPAGARSLRAVCLGACLLALPLGYVFVYLPGLASAGVAALLVTREKRFDDLVLLSALTVLSATVFGAVSADGGDGGLIFWSRLPILTPAVVASAILAPVAAYYAWRSGRGDLLLAASFLAMPAALCNQQLVTGVMVSAKDWERNINYPLLAAGIALAVPALTGRFHGTGRRSGLVAVTAALALATLIVVAQTRSYRLWLPTNLRSVAMARALENAGAEAAGARLVLDDVSLAPLLAVRRAGSKFVLDYTVVFVRRVPVMTTDGARPASQHETDLFEYFWRVGRTPADVETLLAAEASARGGFFLSFLFSFKDHWHPATDNRLVRQAGIVRALPAIVEDYRRFLAAGGRPRPHETVVRLASAPVVSAADGVMASRIGVGAAGPEAIHAYRQTP